MAPTFDQHHRPHQGPAVTPSRAPVMPSPVQNSPAMPHVAHAGNQYNLPRAAEVYTLPPQTEAAIPEDVRAQFHRDGQGRILFFSAPPLAREHPGVAPEYAHLGHSVSHLANVKKLREERARKRKERDEQEAARQTPEKQRVQARTADGSKASRPAARDHVAEAILAWADSMDHGTAVVNAEMAGWKEAKEQIRKDNAGLTEKQRTAAELQQWADDRVKRGTMTDSEKADFIDTYVTKSVRLNAAR